MKKLLLGFVIAIVGTIIFSEGKGLLTIGILRPLGTVSDLLQFIMGEAEVAVTVFLGMGVALLTGIVITAILMAQKMTWRKGLSLIGILIVTMLGAALIAGLRTAVSFVILNLPLGGLLPGLLYTLFMLLLIAFYLTFIAVWTKKVIWG